MQACLYICMLARRHLRQGARSPDRANATEPDSSHADLLLREDFPSVSRNQPQHCLNKPERCWWTRGMKLLLDESAPRRLASLYPEPFDVRPVPQMVWAGRGFAALVTVDQGMEPEQNVDNLPVPVIILIATRNRLQDRRPPSPSRVRVEPAGPEHNRR